MSNLILFFTLFLVSCVNTKILSGNNSGAEVDKTPVQKTYESIIIHGHESFDVSDSVGGTSFPDIVSNQTGSFLECQNNYFDLKSFSFIEASEYQNKSTTAQSGEYDINSYGVSFQSVMEQKTVHDSDDRLVLIAKTTYANSSLLSILSLDRVSGTHIFTHIIRYNYSNGVSYKKIDNDEYVFLSHGAGIVVLKLSGDTVLGSLISNGHLRPI